jgi:hypothetical protein
MTVKNNVFFLFERDLWNRLHIRDASGAPRSMSLPFLLLAVAIFLFCLHRFHDLQLLCDKI